MNSVDLDNIKPNEIKVYHNEIEKNGNISKSLDQNLIKKLHLKIS